MPVTQPAGAITTLRTGTYTDVVFSNDGSEVYAASANGISVIDVATGVVSKTYLGGLSLGGVDLSPDGNFLAVVDKTASDTSAFLYRISLTDDAVWGFAIPSPSHQALNDVVLLDNSLAVVSGENEASLRLVNLQNSTSSYLTPALDDAILTESGGQTPYVLAQNHLSASPLYSFDSSTNIVRTAYPGNGIEGSLTNSAVGAVSPGGDFVVQGSLLRVYDKALSFVADLGASFPYLRDVAGLAFSHDSTSLFVATRDGELIEFSTSNWNAIAAYPIGGVPIDPDTGSGYGDILQLSPDGHHLSVITTGGIQLIDVSMALPVATAGADALDGSGFIYGLDGDDVLTGSGASFMYGGTGNDTYVPMAPADKIGEYVGQGTDVVQSEFTYQLGDNLENLTLTGTAAIDGTGNELANVIIGNGAPNVLNGGSGSDTLTGGADSDTLTGDVGYDIFKDTAANLNGDTITDFSAGDKIVITDATLAGFTFSLSGHTLTYTAGSLTLTNLPSGSIIASAAAGGGVQLAFQVEGAVPRAGDFNGDGRDDVVWRSDSGAATYWLGQANGGLATNPNFNLNPGTDWHVVGSGDFNGDGHDDLLWRSDSGTVTDFLGQSNGAFVGNVNFNLNPGLDWHVVGTGDFNGDGFGDILWRSDSGTTVDLLGQSNGAFVGNVNFNLNPGLDWHVVGTGDFNGDGKDDILWRNDAGTVVDLLGNANGSFTGNVNFNLNPGLDWHIEGTGDFNGDGCDDILWRSDNGTVVDLLGQANGSFTGNVNFNLNPGLDWHIVETGDFNGDGCDDILWRSDNGTVTDLLGQPNGSFIGNIANLSVNPGTVWHVQSQEMFF
jgi:Ca2+-binding RTX toxin-like protein